MMKGIQQGLVSQVLMPNTKSQNFNEISCEDYFTKQNEILMTNSKPSPRNIFGKSENSAAKELSQYFRI